MNNEAKVCARCGARLRDTSAIDVCLRCVAGQLIASGELAEGQATKGTAGGETLDAGLERPSDPPMDSIGSYQLIERIGEGGGGVVYIAEQIDPVRRRVALKVLKPGMDTRRVVARFEAERQALAMMDHPNIARVFDAGSTEGGRPYFVMELVRGARLTDYCDEARLPTTERLELFVQVCLAVQHAHQKGIIHRDLKPSNILVTTHDGRPVPKVIDFGIAKATEPSLTDQTLATESHELLGTPAYMSPEQAQRTGIDIDTRSDIYSLGVLLYELVTGRLPLDARALKQAGLDELRRTICEVEPPRPSTRLSALPPGDATLAAQQRSTEAPRLIQALRGDIDWIVMKCLEKDRSRRYETASALAAEVRRHLVHQPVIARPPSLLYVLRKTVRRHRVLVMTSGAVLTAVVAGLALSTFLFLQERQTRRRAVDAENSASASAQRAQRSANESRERLRKLQIDTGARHVRDHDLMGSLPWFVEAFKLDDSAKKDAGGAGDAVEKDGDGDDNAAVHQFRLASIFAQCPRPMQIVFHSGPVNEALLSPDGSRALCVTRANEAVVWDVASGESAATLKAEAFLTGATFSPDGRRALVEGVGRSFLWDLGVQPAVVQALDTNGPIVGSIWSSDGASVLTLGEREFATLWNVADGKPVARLGHSPGARLLTAAFVPAELAQPVPSVPAGAGTIYLPEVILTVDSAGLLQFWSAHDGQRIAERALEPKGAPWQLARLSPDGTRLMTIHNPDDPSAPSHARLWSVRAGRPVGEPLGHDSFIHPPVFGRNLVVTGSHDGTARVWDTRNGALKVSPLRHGSDVSALALSADGNLLITGCVDGTARVWSVALGRPIGPPLLHGSAVSAVAFGPANHTVLTTAIDGTARIWNLAAAPRLVWRPYTAPGRSSTYRPQWGVLDETPDGVTARGLQPGSARTIPVTWRGKFAPAPGASMTPDGSRVLIPQEVEGKVEFQLLSVTGQALGPIFAVPGNAENLFGTSLSADGTRFVLRNGTHLQVWNVTTGQPDGPEIVPEARPSTPDLSPDGRTLVWRNEGKVIVWDIAARRERFPAIQQSGRIFPSGFSRDSRRLLTVSDGSGADLSCARVWDTTTGQPVSPPMPHAAPLNNADFSPDGRLIVTASQDRTVGVWDAVTGERRTPSLEHPDDVHMAYFSQDQRRVYTACEDGAVRIWDAATGEPLAAPIEHHYPVRYVFPLLGGRVLHSTSQYNHNWDLPDHPRPLADWEAIAQLLTARRLDGAGQLRVLDRAELSHLWHTLKARLPEDFSTSLGQREDWNNWMNQLYFANKHWSKARAHLDELVALQPDVFIYRWNRAYANRSPDRWDAAVADLQAAARIDPAENAIWADLAQAELARGNLSGYQAACATMTKRLSFADRKVHLGDWCFVACTASNPPALLQNLHRLLLEMGPPPPSTLYVRGRDWQYRTALGALAFRLGRDAEAVENLEKARAMRDGDRSTAIYLAMAHHRLGHHDRAHALLERARAQFESDQHLFDLGRAFDSHGGLAADRMLLREADGMIHESKAE